MNKDKKQYKEKRKFIMFLMGCIFLTSALLYLVSEPIEQPECIKCECSSKTHPRFEQPEKLQRIELYYEIDDNETILYHEEGVYDEGWKVLEK